MNQEQETRLVMERTQFMETNDFNYAQGGIAVMERRFNPGEIVWYTLVEKKYYRDWRKKVSTPHPKVTKHRATFIAYVGERRARVLIHRSDGRSPVETIVLTRHLSHIETNASL